jgi:hypothetical protein
VKLCALSSSTRLFQNCKDTTVVQWEADDSNFEAFDTIVRTYPQIVLSHLEQLNVWPILEWHSSPSRKAELRLKTMTAIETVQICFGVQ